MYSDNQQGDYPVIMWASLSKAGCPKLVYLAGTTDGSVLYTVLLWLHWTGPSKMTYCMIKVAPISLVTQYLLWPPLLHHQFPGWIRWVWRERCRSPLQSHSALRYHPSCREHHRHLWRETQVKTAQCMRNESYSTQRVCYWYHTLHLCHHVERQCYSTRACFKVQSMYWASMSDHASKDI